MTAEYRRKDLIGKSGKHVHTCIGDTSQGYGGDWWECEGDDDGLDLILVSSCRVPIKCCAFCGWMPGDKKIQLFSSDNHCCITEEMCSGKIICKEIDGRLCITAHWDEDCDDYRQEVNHCPFCGYTKERS